MFASKLLWLSMILNFFWLNKPFKVADIIHVSWRFRGDTYFMTKMIDFRCRLFLKLCYSRLVLDKWTYCSHIWNLIHPFDLYNLGSRSLWFYDIHVYSIYIYIYIQAYIHNTVGCCYNAAQYNMIWHAGLWNWDRALIRVLLSKRNPITHPYG